MESVSESRNLVREGQPVHRRQPVALVLCDDPSTDLEGLTSRRCKAAVPFAGKYRLVDFALPNCVNSGIEVVGVITQYQPRSLNAHLACGRPWGLDRGETHLTLLYRYQTDAGISWCTGTADALHRSRDYILHYRADEAFVLAGGEVCVIDLNALTARHRMTKADLTVAAVPAREGAASAHGALAVDREGWVRQDHPAGSAISGRRRECCTRFPLRPPRRGRLPRQAG
jgi:glucose-1-phosphate adenylyltransferase